MKNLAALQCFTQTGATKSCSKALKYFILLIHPLNGKKYTIHVSILSSPSSILTEVDLKGDINKES
jgi:hypothetical protein